MAKGIRVTVEGAPSLNGVEVDDGRTHVYVVLNKKLSLVVEENGQTIELFARHIEITFAADLDPNGQNPIFHDSTLSDDSGIVFGLNESDETLSADSHFTDIQAPVTDQADSADELVTNVEAPLSDATSNTDNEMGFGFQHSDAESATDSAEVDVEALASDLAESVDQVHTNVESGISDTAQSSDSGVGYIQDYIDDYFEPDYIGREFSF
ncbi:MAG: hypothetical protein CML17_02200 [Pusillimonas sp.]|nr:hypothetical protein [Pusillimonas sp.]